MCAATGLAQCRADVDGLDLITLLLLLGMGDGVGHDQSAQAAAVEVINGLAGQDAVHHNGIDLLGTMLHDGVGSLDEGATGIGHIVNDNGNLVLNVTDEDHAGDLVRTRTFLVDEGKLQIEAVGNTRRSVGKRKTLDWD